MSKTSAAEQEAAAVRAPLSPEQVTGTGSTPVGTTNAVTVGMYATLKNGATAIRVGFGATKAAAEAAALSTSPIVAAYESFPWLVASLDDHVAARAADAASAYEFHVWVSSGPR